VPAPLHSAKVETPPRTEPARTPAEERLLAALQAQPGGTVIALAAAAGARRSATGERLRRLARDGIVEKDGDGHWRVKPKEPGPMEASSS